MANSERFRELYEIAYQTFKNKSLQSNVNAVIYALLSNISREPEALLRLCTKSRITKDNLASFVQETFEVDVSLLKIPAATIKRIQNLLRGSEYQRESNSAFAMGRKRRSPSPIKRQIRVPAEMSERNSPSPPPEEIFEQHHAADYVEQRIAEKPLADSRLKLLMTRKPVESGDSEDEKNQSFENVGLKSAGKKRKLSEENDPTWSPENQAVKLRTRKIQSSKQKLVVDRQAPSTTRKGDALPASAASLSGSSSETDLSESSRSPSPINVTRRIPKTTTKKSAYSSPTKTKQSSPLGTKAEKKRKIDNPKEKKNMQTRSRSRQRRSFLVKRASASQSSSGEDTLSSSLSPSPIVVIREAVGYSDRASVHCSSRDASRSPSQISSDKRKSKDRRSRSGSSSRSPSPILVKRSDLLISAASARPARSSTRSLSPLVVTRRATHSGSSPSSSSGSTHSLSPLLVREICRRSSSPSSTDSSRSLSPIRLKMPLKSKGVVVQAVRPPSTVYKSKIVAEAIEKGATVVKRKPRQTSARKTEQKPRSPRMKKEAPAAKIKGPLIPPIKYHCDYCSASCSNSFNLRRHVENVHDRRIYACARCPAKFMEMRSLNDHFARHLPNPTLYVCANCRVAFISRQARNGHAKRCLGDRA